MDVREREAERYIQDHDCFCGRWGVQSNVNSLTVAETFSILGNLEGVRVFGLEYVIPFCY